MMRIFIPTIYRNNLEFFSNTKPKIRMDLCKKILKIKCALSPSLRSGRRQLEQIKSIIAYHERVRIDFPTQQPTGHQTYARADTGSA